MSRYVEVAQEIHRFGIDHPDLRDDFRRLSVAVLKLRPNRPDPSEDAEGKSRKNHPDTAKKAAYRAKQKSGTQRERILQLLKWSHPGGMIDEEISASLNIVPNAERPRRVELVEMGWVEDSGKTRKTVADLDAIIWRYVKI